MTNLRTQSLIALAVIGVTATHANAQSDYYSRDKYEAVTDRQQPDFDPDPVRLGAFVVSSDATVGVFATDNVFATNDNPGSEAKESDAVVEVSAGGRARTDWNNHEFGLRGRIGRSEFLDFSDESFTDLSIGTFGRLDARRDIQLTADLGHSRSVESRANYASGSVLDAPIDTSETSLRLGADYLNDRVRWSNGLRFSQRDFEDGSVRGTDAVFEQDFRDVEIMDFTSRLSYAISPNVAVYGQGTVRQRDYDSDQIVFDPVANMNVARSRDSDGYTLAAGVNFETTNLLRGDVAVGFLSEDQKDEAFEDVEGLSLDGRVEWFPSRLTTVTFDAGRRVADNGLISSPNTLQTRYGVNVDHEFSRQIIGRVFANRLLEDFQATDREDELTRLGTGVTYKLNKRVHVTGSFQNVNRDASGQIAGFDPGFSANEVGISLSFFP